jgi:hypothetical protein
VTAQYLEIRKAEPVPNAHREKLVLCPRNFPEFSMSELCQWLREILQVRSFVCIPVHGPQLLGNRHWRETHSFEAWFDKNGLNYALRAPEAEGI